MTVPYKKAPANFVPAAAVIRGGQALSGIIGCKGLSVGTMMMVPTKAAAANYVPAAAVIRRQ